MLRGGMATQTVRIQRQPLFWGIIPSNEAYESAASTQEKGMCPIYHILPSCCSPFHKHLKVCVDRDSPPHSAMRRELQKTLQKFFLQRVIPTRSVSQMPSSCHGIHWSSWACNLSRASLQPVQTGCPDQQLSHRGSKRTCK